VRHQVLASLLIMLLCLSMAGGSSEQTPSTPTNAKAIATGQTIGTIVSAAFNTAFPIIGRIMDLFKKPATTTPPTADKNKKNPPTPAEPTATKTEVQAAVDKAQNDAKKAFKEEMQPTASVAKELAVIQTFGDGSAKANLNLAAIKRLMSETKPDYSKIKTEWTKFNLHMADILTVKKSDIQLVHEVEIQSRLLTLQESRKELMQDITDNIDRAVGSKPDFSKTELESQISAMAALLNGFDSLAAAELGVLQSDIEKLSVWANSPAGGEADFKPKAPDKDLLEIAAAAATESTRVLHKQH